MNTYDPDLKTKVKPNDKPPRPPANWGVSTAAFTNICRYKPIRIVFMDGKAFQGKLVGVDTYDLFLEFADGSTALIPKHAVKYILPAPEGDAR